MSIVRPFRAARPMPDKVTEVAAPPYDVIETEEARERVKGHPFSFLHVSRAEVDLDPSVDVHDSAVYEKGRENLNRFMSEKILVQDSKPCFYFYRLKMGGHEQTGLYACVSIEDYEKSVIKKHENTRIDKEMDRSHHIDTLNAHTGPVFLMYHHRDEIQGLFKQAVGKKPAYQFVHDYGVEHTFWVVDDDALITAIEKAFSEVDYLYIADGHHRAASATRVGKDRREKNPKHTGREEYNFFPALIFPDSEMQILNYNRAVKDLNGLSKADFLARIAERFAVAPSLDQNGKPLPCQPDTLHRFGMLLDGAWYRLTPKPSLFNENDPIDSLDVSILQNHVLAPILGIDDPRTNQRIRFVGGIRGLSELEKMVSEGQSAVAFSLFPTGIDQLMAVADAGKVMPPKSTWFEPKPRSGLAVHFLD